MSGTKAGGLKAAKTNKEKHGEDFYVKMGRLGGMAITDKPKGFAAMTPERRAECGRIGGMRGKRGPAK